jgi:hypothetical protein
MGEDFSFGYLAGTELRPGQANAAAYCNKGVSWVMTAALRAR